MVALEETSQKSFLQSFTEDLWAPVLNVTAIMADMLLCTRVLDEQTRLWLDCQSDKPINQHYHQYTSIGLGYIQTAKTQNSNSILYNDDFPYVSLLCAQRSWYCAHLTHSTSLKICLENISKLDQLFIFFSFQAKPCFLVCKQIHCYCISHIHKKKSESPACHQHHILVIGM